MNASRLAAINGLCAVVFTLTAATAAGNQWGDVELASCCSDSTDSCSSAIDCGCSCSTAACGDGYCFDCPLCDELTCRLTPCMTRLASCGIAYNLQATQFYQGVASGGVERGFEYGGKVDQFFNVDGGKLGLWQGSSMVMHVETRFGDDVNRQAVPFAPVNIAMLYPKSGEHDTAITGLTFGQALSDDLLVNFGKFNAVDLFYMLYPQTGRGVNGFMNASMVIPVSIARVAPLSVMGAGAIKMHGKQVQGAFLVFDTQNSATTSGFDDLFGNGANILGYWRFFTELGGLPGSHGFMGAWSTGEFTAFDPGSFVIVPDEGLVAIPQDGAYSLIYILEQTLWMDRCHKERNVSLLSQWGIADQATSPIGWSANVGIQAMGFSDARPHDSFGVGYFHTGISDDLKNLFSPVLTLQDVNGVEMYYSAAIAKGMALTADLQVIEPANVNNDTAVVLGLRLSAGL